MTDDYGNVEGAVGSGECYNSFSDSESIGSYLVVGGTFTSPFVSLVPFGSAFEVVSSVFIPNNASGYNSIRMKVFPSWLRRGNFRCSSIPLHSGQSSLDWLYLLGMMIQIRKS